MKTIKVPQQLFREAEIIRTKRDDGGEEMSLSISSDTPYLRFDWWDDEEYYEVLDHGPGGMDDSRLKAGLPMLFNHDRDQHLGRASGFNVKDGKCYVTGLKWSESEDAQTKKKDMESGALPDTSVGYQITDEGECIGAKDGKPIYKFKWAPYEFSMVTVPADITVGAGRAADKPSDAPKEIRIRDEKNLAPAAKKQQKQTQVETNMKLSPSARQHFRESDTGANATTGASNGTTVVVDAATERAAGRTAYKAACKKINDYVGALKNPQWKEAAAKIAVKHMELDEPDFETFRSEACNHFDGVLALTTEQANPNVGLDSASIRRFSMVKAIREMSDPKGGLTGLEKEVCEFSAKQYEKKDGRVFMGACIPSDITDSRADETLQLDQRGMSNLAFEMRRLNERLGRTMAASNFTGGGFLVGTELLAGSFIEYLRNACFIGQGPFAIIELGGLVGNVAIPKQTTTATTYWLPEGGSVTAADFAGSQLYGTPHRLACLTQFTKQLLLQSTPAVEMLVRNDQARAVAVEEDRVVFLGAGASGEPIGIVNTTGIDASVTFSGNWTQAKSLAFEYAIENANANMIGEMVFVTGPLTKSYAKGTVQVASSTFPIYIWMPGGGEYPTISGAKGGIVNGYGAYATKQLGIRVLFGIYNNNVCKFRWGGMDLMVEPYTGAATETIKSYLNEWLDIGLRYPQAFSYSTDAPTSP